MIWNRDGITWYSEDEVEVLKKNASAFQKYITQNEQLKTQIDCLVKKNEKLKAENERLLKQKNNVTRKNIVFYATLQEIKAIAEKLMADNLCNNCDGIGLDANCQDTGCPYYQMDKILQRIGAIEQ